MDGEQRRGGFIQTFRRKRFYPLDPRPEDVCVEDIAHALSMACRFAGHTRVLYTVAEHSVRLSRECSPGARLFGLLHDAAEAYLGDIPRPWKRYLHVYDPAAHREIEPLKAAEDDLLWVILRGLGLPDGEPTAAVREEVKRLDTMLLVTEARDLMSQPLLPGWQHTPENGYPALPGVIVPWAPDRAEREFLYRFRELTGEPEDGRSGGA